jgi:hypothetical protein
MVAEVSLFFVMADLEIFEMFLNFERVRRMNILKLVRDFWQLL